MNEYIGQEVGGDPMSTGVGMIVIVGFTAGVFIGLLASFVLRMFGAPVEAMSEIVKE